MRQPPRARHLLILEDDVDLRRQWRHAAEDSGLLCSEAETVDAAEEAIRRSRVDAIIVDMFLGPPDEGSPVKGGMLFIHHLRNPTSERLPSWTVDIPVISVTGSNPTVNALPYARSVGANLTLRKPVPPGYLISAVHQLIADRADS